MNWSNDDGEIEELDAAGIAQAQADYEHARWDEAQATDNLKTDKCGACDGTGTLIARLGKEPYAIGCVYCICTGDSRRGGMTARAWLELQENEIANELPLTMSGTE